MTEVAGQEDAKRKPRDLGGAFRDLLAGRHALAVLSAFLLRALLIPLSNDRTFPLDYWHYPDVLPRVLYFLDAVLFGFAHACLYFAFVSHHFTGLYLGPLQAPVGVVLFVTAGLVPSAICFGTLAHWKLRARVLVPLAAVAPLLVAPIHLLLFVIFVCCPFAAALPVLVWWKRPAAKAIPLGAGLVGLAALNLYCGYHVLIAMVPSM